MFADRFLRFSPPVSAKSFVAGAKIPIIWAMILLNLLTVVAIFMADINVSIRAVEGGWVEYGTVSVFPSFPTNPNAWLDQLLAFRNPFGAIILFILGFGEIVVSPFLNLFSATDATFPIFLMWIIGVISVLAYGIALVLLVIKSVQFIFKSFKLSNNEKGLAFDMSNACKSIMIVGLIATIALLLSFLRALIEVNLLQSVMYEYETFRISFSLFTIPALILPLLSTVLAWFTWHAFHHLDNIENGR